MARNAASWVSITPSPLVSYLPLVDRSANNEKLRDGSSVSPLTESHRNQTNRRKKGTAWQTRIPWGDA